jgi:predicted nuclease with TOPRIM domain
MSEQVGKEFEAEDIEFVKDLQSQYATNTAQLGQVEVELYILNKRLKQMEELRISLFQKYDELQTSEEQLVQKLNEKYGDGVLDLDSGRFIPSGS